MRAISTAVLGLIAVVAFCGFFAITAVLTYLTSPAAMVSTARQGDAYGVMLDVVDRVLAGELKREIEPAFERYTLSRAREVVRQAVPEAWFYSTVTGGFRDLIDIIREDGRARKVALGEVRADLRKELLAVGGQVRGDCARLTGSPACADEGVLAELIQVYDKAVVEVTGRIPAETDLRSLAAESGTDWLAPESPAVQQARQAHLWIQLARWGCLGLFVLALLLITWINYPPLARLLTVVGLILMLAAGTYLAVAHFADDLVALALRQVHAGEDLEVSHDRAREVVPVIEAAAERLAVRAARDALGSSVAPATILLAAGVGSVAGGWLLRRQPPARSS